ncbi:ARM repeat-containing protein [Wallemia mellicola]|nr:ARM repeat-containing protein [Wallemia mellicola]TIC24165.1 ARM repeat-containing protein [Wallemia mellicola]
MTYLNESQLIALAKELKCHMLDPDTTFAAQVIDTIGYLTHTTEKASEFAFKVLASSSASSNKVLSQKSIIQLRNFMNNHIRQSFYLRKLLKRMFGGSIEDDDARAALIWIVSQIISNPPDDEVYNSGEDIIWKYAPDILRKSVLGFSEEGIKTQMQIINLAAKMMTSVPNVSEVHILARKVFMLSNYMVDVDSTNLKHLDAQNRRQALVNAVRGVIGTEEYSTDEMPRIVLRRLQASLVLDTSTKDPHTVDKIASLPQKANPVKIQDDILMDLLPEWSKDDLPSADVRMETYPKGYPEESTSTPTAKPGIEPVVPLKDSSEVVEIPEADEDMLDDDLEKFLDSDSSSNLSDN